MAAHTCDPSSWEVWQDGKKEVKATTLGYTVCLRPAWATFITGHLLKPGINYSTENYDLCKIKNLTAMYR